MGIRNYASYNHQISIQKPHLPIIARKFTRYAENLPIMLALCFSENPPNYARNNVRIIAASLQVIYVTTFNSTTLIALQINVAHVGTYKEGNAKCSTCGIGSLQYRYADKHDTAHP